jgi:acetyl-CoA carboxylase carboxyltransferase component
LALPRRKIHHLGAWRSLVAHSAGGRAVVGSNPTAPTTNPYSAAERGYIDDVIEPQQTRPKLIRALRTLETKRVEQPKRKHGNIPL